MSTFAVNFGMPYAVTTAWLYLDVVQPVPADRHYVVGIKAYADGRPLELKSRGWHFSQHLQTHFSYLPRQDAAAVVKLPGLVLGEEITRLEVQPMVWARGAVPVEEIIVSAWAVMPGSEGTSTIFRAEAETGVHHG